MFLECGLDERYDNLEVFLMSVDTISENAHFTDGDVAMVAVLEGRDNRLDYLDDGDYLMISGESHTANPHYLAQLKIEGDILHFIPTSSHISIDRPPVHRQDFDQVDVIGKVLLTVKGRTVEGLTYSGNFRPYSNSNNRLT